MKNLKEKRLGYEYTNALGHKCKVTAYKSNKDMVVHDTVTDKFHECRWCDLHNPRRKAVFDTTKTEKKDVESLVKESENWRFADEVTSCADDYDEDGNGRGCAASVFVVGMLLAIALLVLGILLW